MRKGAWCGGHEPMTAEIDTGGPPHRISWRSGRLILHDHDLQAEAVLQALGGEPCSCLLVRDAFRRPSVLDERPQGGWTGRASRLVVRRPPGGISQRAIPTSGWVTHSFGTSSSVSARQQLQLLQSDPRFQAIPTQHRDRLLAQLRHEVVMEILPEAMADLLKEVGQLRFSRRVTRMTDFSTPQTRSSPETVLLAAVEPTLKDAMRRSRMHIRAFAELTVKCWRQPPGMPPEIDGHIGKFGGFVSVSLCLSWLNRVWIRGLATVDGYFVLAVDAPAPVTHLRGTAVRWERSPGGDSVAVAAPCLVFKREGDWHLAWC